MYKIFEWLGGLMFLVATLDFVASPRKALNSIYDTLMAPSPRIIGGHLILKKPGKPREGAKFP